MAPTILLAATIDAEGAEWAADRLRSRLALLLHPAAERHLLRSDGNALLRIVAPVLVAMVGVAAVLAPAHELSLPLQHTRWPIAPRSPSAAHPDHSTQLRHGMTDGPGPTYRLHSASLASGHVVRIEERAVALAAPSAGLKQGRRLYSAPDDTQRETTQVTQTVGRTHWDVCGQR